MNNKNSISKISKSIEDENFNDDVNIKNENSRNFENLNQYHKHEPSEYSQIILKVPVNNYTFNMHKNIDEYTNSQKSIKIPDVCKQFNVSHIGTFTLLRRFGFTM